MASYTYTVNNVGSSAYTFSGIAGNNPTLSFNTGDTVTFNMSASGHPFFIKTVSSTGTANQYNSGVTNNGSSTGTITFVIPSDAPSTLFYNCQFHGSMAGTINISGVTTTTTTTTTTTSSTTTTTTTSDPATTTTTTTTTTAAPTTTTTTTTTATTTTSAPITTTTLEPNTTTTTTTVEPATTTTTLEPNVTTTSPPVTTTITTAPPVNTTTPLPIGVSPDHDSMTVWSGVYSYFIDTFISGSSMPPGIHVHFTRTIADYYNWENRNNSFDYWIPDAIDYHDIELQWQIAGANVSRRQGWENRGNPETRVISYDSMERAQYSSTILPEDYEPRGGLEVGGTSTGCIEVNRETLQDFDSPDTISFSVEAQLFTYTSLRVNVTGNWLTYDIVCPPEDPDITVDVYDSKSVTYSLKSYYSPLTSIATQDSISKRLGPSSLPESHPDHLVNGELEGQGMSLYVPSECLGEEQSRQTLNAILRIRPPGSQGAVVGQLETYHSVVYSKSIEVTLSGEESVKLYWDVPKETEIIYDYTDSEWYMAHQTKPAITRQRYEIYGDDKYEIYGYEFQWISNKPDETGWHHWFKITGDDILPTDEYKDANGESQSRDLLYSSSEQGEDLGYIRTIVRGRDGELHRGSLTLELDLENVGTSVGNTQPGVGFVKGVAEEFVGCDGKTKYKSYEYKFRVRAIYRCNRITNRSTRAIMPDGTYDFVPQATILLASSEYYPFKSTDPIPVQQSDKKFGVSFNMTEHGGEVLPTQFYGSANMKSYDIEHTTDDGNAFIDDILDAGNRTTTTTTPEPEFPIE